MWRVQAWKEAGEANRVTLRWKGEGLKGEVLPTSPTLPLDWNAPLPPVLIKVRLGSENPAECLSCLIGSERGNWPPCPHQYPHWAKAGMFTLLLLLPERNSLPGCFPKEGVKRGSSQNILNWQSDYFKVKDDLSARKGHAVSLSFFVGGVASQHQGPPPK